MTHPKGTKVNRWYLGSEKQKTTRVSIIRRWVTYLDGTKKLERYPSKKIKGLSELELKDLVIRLNHQVPKEQRTKEAVELKHAFISPALLDQYKEFLLTQVPNQDKAISEYGYLYKYFIVFHIGILNNPDPLDWHKNHKTTWAKYLLGPDSPKSADAKRDIIRAANRFMQWLHEQRPLEVPPLRFQPISKAKFKEIEAIRELNGEIHIPQYIRDKDWGIISGKLPDSIRSATLLAYNFGLRRSETLGIKAEDLRNTYLSVERQLKTYSIEPGYAPLKGRERRKVPLWGVDIGTAYTWVGSIKLMHPDTFTEVWGDLMDTLDFKYTIHDLRHTWITRMVRKHDLRDVQLAAGHKSPKTTERYLHDDRDLSDEIYVPKTG